MSEPASLIQIKLSKFYFDFDFYFAKNAKRIDFNLILI